MPAAGTPPGGLAVAILRRPGDAAAYEATRRALPGTAEVFDIAARADWARLGGRALAILQAGEIPAPGALGHFAAALRAHPATGFAYADLDHADAAGHYHTPLFKPGFDPLLLRAGLLTRGLCAFPAGKLPDLPLHADAARLQLGLHRQAAGAVHIPHVLTTLGPVLAPRPPFPAVPAVSGSGEMPAVTAVVATAGRSGHVLDCLRSVLGRTRYPRFELLVVVSGPAAGAGKGPDAALLRALGALPRLRLIMAPPGRFNYARSNNHAAARVDTPLLLLLNDDVAVADPAWLRVMAAHLADPGVAAVGARLLHADGSVQHDGVILGLGGLCGNAARLAREHELQAAACSPAGLDRAVSAVTAACLLTRTADFCRVGGFDERYAVALNDTDLCLRLAADGRRVVQASSARLWHYESLSLRQHYGEGRAGLEPLERGWLRAAWGPLLRDDPRYSPNASLQPGREWRPAFPPRIMTPHAVAAPSSVAKGEATRYCPA
jgi:GT2 family glycosyltransferase